LNLFQTAFLFCGLCVLQIDIMSVTEKL